MGGGWGKTGFLKGGRDFAKYITSGLSYYEFHIGLSSARDLKGATANMLSARQNPAIIEEYIQKEVGLDNILGPFPKDSLGGIHINRFGCIKKKHQPGKRRLITDLPFPRGHNVNDAIDSKLCSLAYVSV